MQSAGSPVVAVGREQPPLLHTCAHTPPHRFHAFISEPEKYVRQKQHPFIIAYSKHKLIPTRYTLVSQDLTHNSTGFYKGHILVLSIHEERWVSDETSESCGYWSSHCLIFCKMNYLMGDNVCVFRTVPEAPVQATDDTGQNDVREGERS